MELLVLLQPEPQSLAGSVVATVDRLTTFVLQYVGAIAAVGAFSMAFIEAGKKLLDSRTKFQALRCTRWVVQTATPSRPDAAPADVLREVIQLCTGVPVPDAEAASTQLIARRGHLDLLNAWNRNPAHAVFALDLDRMMGVIQEAADVSLTSPKEYPGLYHFLTAGARQDDVTGWFEQADRGMADLANEDPGADQRLRTKLLADQYGRLRQIMRRKLDGFQLYTGDRWASWNQFLANAVGILVMFAVLMLVRRASATPPRYGTVLLLSLLGGALAPVAKDLVSALQRARSG